MFLCICTRCSIANISSFKYMAYLSSLRIRTEYSSLLRLPYFKYSNFTNDYFSRLHPNKAYHNNFPHNRSTKNSFHSNCIRIAQKGYRSNQAIFSPNPNKCAFHKHHNLRQQPCKPRFQKQVVFHYQN